MGAPLDRGAAVTESVATAAVSSCPERHSAGNSSGGAGGLSSGQGGGQDTATTAPTAATSAGTAGASTAAPSFSASTSATTAGSGGSMGISPEQAGNDRPSKRARVSSFSVPPSSGQAAAAAEIFGPGGSDAGNGRLWLGAQTATVEWRLDQFHLQRQRADGVCLDGPKFGQREVWQVFCHPDGRCFNQPQGGPPGVFLRYLGPHERVPAYATIEKLVDGEFRVPENNARDAPFVVLFGRNDNEDWGVCKDFGLFEDAFVDEALVLRARVAWIEPRADSLLPREAVMMRRNAAPSFAGVEGSLQADLSMLWNARRPPCAGPSGGPAILPCNGVVPADLVLVCEQQKFEADRAILAARSSFFGAMFSNRKFREAGQREVDLPEMSTRALSAVLRFIYTDEGPDMRTREEAEEILTAASKLGIAGMLRLCSDYLRDTWLTVTSAVGLLRLADEHGATSLRSEALAVLGANFDHVKSTPEWDDLLRHGMNPALIQDTLQAVADASIFAGRASIQR
eukprot:TRINITY_DN75320_c0_g1_i1.p1 TRINITY_DN75320_c0_g1~~TRINITY_DN75320_c0_g1_i1.p1  ORF type:complete len:512 (-),score=74.43 TRINITY_DN75320_c0_g1_i1:220-1755(-)